VAKATRTLNPPHFEDLEPHRFEDLVRQLVYDFKSWRKLEPTGRGGSDDGFDVRGYEAVPAEEVPVRTGDDELEDDGAGELGQNDRLWLVQCKCEKSISPRKLRDYLEAIPCTTVPEQEPSDGGRRSPVARSTCRLSQCHRFIARVLAGAGSSSPRGARSQ
jgi:hypothetical protein